MSDDWRALADWTATAPCPCFRTGCDLRGVPAHREEAYLALLAELTHPDDECVYDHHGYCQTHDLADRPCPHSRAKRLISAARGDA